MLARISFWLSRRALKVELWHSIPLKAIQWDSKVERFAATGILFLIYKLFTQRAHEKEELYAAPSEAIRDIFLSALRARRESILIAGLPRNDSLFNLPDGFLIGGMKPPMKVSRKLKKIIKTSFCTCQLLEMCSEQSTIPR